VRQGTDADAGGKSAYNGCKELRGGWSVEEIKSDRSHHVLLHRPDPFAPDARAECSRKTLQKLTDTYVKAVTAGKATLLPLAAKSSYTVNDKPMGVSEGVLAGPLKVDFTRSLYDTTQCAAFMELEGSTDPYPYVIHTQLEATKDGKIVKLESRVTHDGDWMFGAAEHLRFTQEEKWDEIPRTSATPGRSSRR
jgi:hypothetical protein